MVSTYMVLLTVPGSVSATTTTKHLCKNDIKNVIFANLGHLRLYALSSLSYAEIPEDISKPYSSSMTSRKARSSFASKKHTFDSVQSVYDYGGIHFAPPQGQSMRDNTKHKF